jgi:hypothetical protein
MIIKTQTQITRNSFTEFGDTNSFKDHIMMNLASMLAKEILKNNYYILETRTPDTDLSHLDKESQEYKYEYIKQQQLKFNDVIEYTMIIDINPHKQNS